VNDPGGEGRRRLKAVRTIPFSISGAILKTPAVSTRDRAKKVSFPARADFHRELRKRVNRYFDEGNRSRAGDWRMFLKTVLIAVWLVGSYISLVFLANSVLTVVLSAFALAQGFVLVGFNVMHDGGHGSYSRNKAVNRLMAWSLDLVGGSQMHWAQKHNILHHTYTNIEGWDDDLETHGLIRLSPNQPWRPWHRFQHLYALPLYSLLTLSWIFYSDFQKFFSGRIGNYRLRKPSTGETASFFVAKVVYVGYALVLPLLIHPPLHVLAVFLFVHLILGLTISLVFQMAHTVEGNQFPEPEPETGFIEDEWSVHELETTADFAPTNRLATWYLGGLNFQIEHHLFSKICHIHYPALSGIVRDACRDFEIAYTCYPTVRAALAGHFRFLRRMGAAA
jgi:linoleoyl-CoA desaturase